MILSDRKIMIYMLLADGFEEVEALAPLDMLRRASLDVKTVSLEKGKEVRGSHGISVIADLMPNEASEVPTLLILPGGMPGSERIDASDVTDDMLSRVQKAGGRIAAICAAPMVLGKRGLLQGKNAVCYPGFEKFLLGAHVEKKSVVTDGNVTTAIGMGAAVAFGAELVSLMTDASVAQKMLEAIKAI